jgi:hypothetical protein
VGKRNQDGRCKEDGRELKPEALTLFFNVLRDSPWFSRLAFQHLGLFHPNLFKSNKTGPAPHRPGEKYFRSIPSFSSVFYGALSQPLFSFIVTYEMSGLWVLEQITDPADVDTSSPSLADFCYENENHGSRVPSFHTYFQLFNGSTQYGYVLFSQLVIYYGFRVHNRGSHDDSNLL